MFRIPTLLLCAALAVSCGAKSAKTAYKGRTITLTDAILDAGGTDTVRFGRMHSGEIAVLQFRLENAASRPTAITSYERSCGCTTLEYDPQPITPGKDQRISLLFDSRGERGWQLKIIDISLAGGRAPMRLYIEAEVE